MHSGCWQVVRSTSRRSMVRQHHWYSMRASSCGYRVGSDVSRHILQLIVVAYEEEEESHLICVYFFCILAVLS